MKSGRVKNAPGPVQEEGRPGLGRTGNAVYPALAAPPTVSPGQSHGVDAHGADMGPKKVGVMDRARVKTGGARGFGTGSLYQWE